MAVEMFVITNRTRDYGDRFVVRRWLVLEDRMGADKEPIAVCDTLAGARLAVPEGVANVGRFERDDPCIVEVWL